MTVTIIMCRGIGEKRHDNLLWNHLRPEVAIRAGARIRFIDLDWPAIYGPVGGGRGNQSSYARNLERGLEMLTDEVDRARDLFTLGTRNKVLLAGFSAGGTLVGNYGASGFYRVNGVGLVADPMRPSGTGAAGFIAPGHGVGGERVLNPLSTEQGWWISDPRDMITSCPERSPLRTIADQTWAMSFHPGEAPAWIADLADRVKRQRWQPSAIDWRDVRGTIQRYAQAADDAAGYLFRGEHVQYAIRPYPRRTDGATYIQVLADLIAKEITQ